MIKFSPVANDKLPEPFCNDNSLNGYLGFDMSSGGAECGFSVFRLNGYTMEIIDIVTESDDETVEGFIRSSLMMLPTVFSLPGMGCAEITTRSSIPSFTLSLVPKAIL